MQTMKVSIRPVGQTFAHDHDPWNGWSPRWDCCWPSAVPHRTTSRRSRSQVPDDARIGPKNDEGELESATAPFQVANLDQNAISSTTSCRQTEHSSERLSPSGGRDRANPLPTTMPQAITAYVTWTLRSRVTLRVFSIRVLARPLGYPPSNSHSPPAPPT